MQALQAVNTGEWQRIVLWGSWVANTLIDITYAVLSWITAANLIKSFKSLDIPLSSKAWRAPISASILGGVMVVLYNCISCWILVRKSSQRKNGVNFDYGFIVAFAFVMSFYTLICGLILHGFVDTVTNELEALPTWGSYDTGAYYGAFILAYICFAIFMAFFLCLVIFQGGMSKHMGLREPKIKQLTVEMQPGAIGAMAPGMGTSV